MWGQVSLRLRGKKRRRMGTVMLHHLCKVWLGIMRVSLVRGRKVRKAAVLIVVSPLG